MRKWLYFLFIFLLAYAGNMKTTAQTKNPPYTRLLRFYNDNDLYYRLGAHYDRSYSSGIQLHYFYTKVTPSGFLLDRVLPGVGESGINVLSWGLTQLMYTPEDITATAFQADDYPYVGALFLTRSLYSYHPIQKYDIQTELSFGVRGPAAFAKETQGFIHSFVGVKRAKGWSNQLKTKLLANYNIKAEKQLAAYGGKLELIAGGQVYLGTMTNAISLSTIIRIGKISPYFNGYMTQFSGSSTPGNPKGLQAYLFIKPEVSYTLHNGILTGESQTEGLKTNSSYSTRKFNYSFTAGAVLTYVNFGAAINQNLSGALLRGLYNHQVGNISLYYSW